MLNIILWDLLYNWEFQLVNGDVIFYIYVWNVIMWATCEKRQYYWYLPVKYNCVSLCITEISLLINLNGMFDGHIELSHTFCVWHNAFPEYFIYIYLHMFLSKKCERVIECIKWLNEIDEWQYCFKEILRSVCWFSLFCNLLITWNTFQT